MQIKIIKIKHDSIFFSDLINLELLLWPDNEYNNLYNETINSNNDYFGAVINNQLVGFIQVSIRTDYVNGSTTSPVGFIEGIYVKSEYRRRGIAKLLFDYACTYLKEKGITEIGSDVLINNLDSQRFHEQLGFKEMERVVCYIKKV